MSRRTITVTLTRLEAETLLQVAGEGFAADYQSLKDYVTGGRRGINVAIGARRKINEALRAADSQRDDV